MFTQEGKDMNPLPIGFMSLWMAQGFIPVQGEITCNR